MQSTVRTAVLRILYCSTSIEILAQPADFSADQTEIQCQFRSASSMQPAGGLPVWVKPWQNGHFGAEMQPGCSPAAASSAPPPRRRAAGIRFAAARPRRRLGCAWRIFCVHRHKNLVVRHTLSPRCATRHPLHQLYEQDGYQPNAEDERGVLLRRTRNP